MTYCVRSSPIYLMASSSDRRAWHSIGVQGLLAEIIASHFRFSYS